MLSKYRRPSTKRIAPVPQEFAAEFIRGGHRRVERMYGCRSDCKVVWMEMAGGERKLKAARRSVLAGRATIQEALATLHEIKGNQHGSRRET